MTTKNDVTGDALRSRGPSKAYEDGWERIFGKKEEIDPANREWEYDGDGTKIYKLEAGKGVKTPYPETDLDGGVPLKKT